MHSDVLVGNVKRMAIGANLNIGHGVVRITSSPFQWANPDQRKASAFLCFVGDDWVNLVRGAL